ncbi:hypothetical protein K376_07082 [Streptomyces sp. PsTaAH-130]|nr:hypothetical protein K376_07082 [Streptomyces sp. PsTaAH-130]
MVRAGAGATAFMAAPRIRSITGMNCGASPHWPGVISGARGRRPPSPARWILQVGPPRKRPSPSSGRCCRGVVLFPVRGRLLRALAACWWARQVVESSLTIDQSMRPSARSGPSRCPCRPASPRFTSACAERTRRSRGCRAVNSVHLRLRGADAGPLRQPGTVPVRSAQAEMDRRPGASRRDPERIVVIVGQVVGGQQRKLGGGQGSFVGDEEKGIVGPAFVTTGASFMRHAGSGCGRRLRRSCTSRLGCPMSAKGCPVNDLWHAD